MRKPVGHGEDRPWVAAALGESYSFQSAHVWDMPCCPCFQMVCQRSDGTVLVIFKHEETPLEPHPAATSISMIANA